MLLLFMHVVQAFSDAQALCQLVVSSELASEAFRYATKMLDPSMLQRIWRRKYYVALASPKVFRTSLTHLFPFGPLYPTPPHVYNLG